MEARQALARKDNIERRAKVEQARALIYEQGYAVNSIHVEALLKEESLVPTVVRPVPLN